MIELLTWMPALVLPSAALIQLVKLWKTHDPGGVSVLSWLMFGIANIGAYLHSVPLPLPGHHCLSSIRTTHGNLPRSPRALPKICTPLRVRYDAGRWAVGATGFLCVDRSGYAGSVYRDRQFPLSRFLAYGRTAPETDAPVDLLQQRRRQWRPPSGRFAVNS